MVTGQFVQRGVELARLEGFAGLYLLAAFPPFGVGTGEDFRLRGRFGLPVIGPLFDVIFEP
jgi:hypothetical protein